MISKHPESLDLKPLAPYEDRLLNALAFFRTQRDNSTQASSLFEYVFAAIGGADYV